MTLSITERSTVQRGKKRAITDRAVLHDILDRNLFCHLGVVVDSAPRVLPTGYGRDGDTLYLHGSSGARSLRTGGEVCVTVTECNGVVYARSVFHFSMNYASAVIHGVPRVVAGDRKLHGLRVVTEHLAPGSWDYARAPTAKELAKTTVLALDLAEAAVKVRDGDPSDDEEDLGLPVWAGVLPIHRTFTAPRASADLRPGVTVPSHVARR